MPTVKNKATGKSYPVSNEEADKIKRSGMGRGFTFSKDEVKEPAEVTALKTEKREKLQPKKAAKKQAPKKAAKKPAGKASPVVQQPTEQNETEPGNS